MPRRTKAFDDLEAILEVMRAEDGEVSVGEIEAALSRSIARRTLQARLRALVEDGRLVRTGTRRWTRYSLPPEALGSTSETEEKPSAEPEQQPELAPIPLSREARAIERGVRRALTARTPVGYDRSLLDRYEPNETHYLSQVDRERLRKWGTPAIAPQPAGTYARQVLDRLLIDLSWNSSRLEGNTYSLLDTRRLLAFSQEADGSSAVEAQMILNHKVAIEFLVESAEVMKFDRHTILNLHALIAQNLLPNPDSEGRVRRILVGIHGSVYYPLEVPQLIEECFDQLLVKANAIADPFEQAFFVMVQIPYLQPFDDANKRLSRLAANIPLIRDNLCPLSFTDVPTELYTRAVLGVYEQRRVELLRDVFLWAYQRSAQQYAAVRQTLGEPDPFRLRYRQEIREVVQDIVRSPLGRREALQYLRDWSLRVIDSTSREQFLEVVETELLALHEGNFARYRIRPSEFDAWQKVW
jgi:Fic family protein